MTNETMLATTEAPVETKTSLMRVSISATASEGLRAKIALIQEMAEDGWKDAEIALMFGLSKSWTGMLRRDVTFFFYCNACGSQVATKKSECRQCN